VLVRVVVLAGAVVDLAAWMATLDLDCGVSDSEPPAQPALQVTHHMLGVAQGAVLEDHVDAEGHLFR
jgi:hypothetical protein